MGRKDRRFSNYLDFPEFWKSLEIVNFFFAESRPLYLRAIQNFGFDAQIYSSTDGNLYGVEEPTETCLIYSRHRLTKHVANIQFLFYCIFNELELESSVILDYNFDG